MTYILSYDRKTENDPLKEIIEVLFKYGAKNIKKKLASTLSFDQGADFLIEKKYHDELSELCYFLIVDSIMMDEDLNEELVSNGNEEIFRIVRTLI